MGYQGDAPRQRQIGVSEGSVELGPENLYVLGIRVYLRNAVYDMVEVT